MSSPQRALNSEKRRGKQEGYGLSTTPPKPSEATFGIFIDNSPVRRYCSGQKKRWFKIPIQMALTDLSGVRFGTGPELPKRRVPRPDLRVAARWESKLPLCRTRVAERQVYGINQTSHLNGNSRSCCGAGNVLRRFRPTTGGTGAV